MILAEVKVDNIYIVCGYTDMRKSITGLSTIIVQQFEMQPDEHSMFLFCGKRADRMKALIWEGDGFLMLYKVLIGFRLPMAAQCKRSPGFDRATVSSSFGRLGYRAETLSAAERFSVKNMKNQKDFWPSNLQRLYFGKKSEKIRIPAMEDGAVQLSIFSQEEPAPISQPVEPETIEVSGHKRKKKRTQEEIIAELPVVVHEHKIPQGQLSCPRCGNEELEYIGKELVYTEYVRVPAHVDRHDHYVEKYACHACEEGTGACEECLHAGTDACKTCADKPKTVIITGSLPEEYRHPFIMGSKASSSVFSQILYEKFELGLSEYRQEKEWERLGFPLSRQTMSNWILRADKDYMQPLTAYMLKTVKDGSNVVNCDETPVKVLDEKTENGNPKKCHMWVVRSGKYEPKQLVVFNYRPSKAGKVPTGILAGYNHYFVRDGYSGYNDLGRGAIRPFVIGRKNWLFCKSNDGAVAAADAYSLVETAKANGLDVLKYLNFVFRKIPVADGNLSDDFIESLMPWNEIVRAECQRGYI